MPGSIFISYRRTQRQAIDSIAKMLEARGVQVWIDDTDIDALEEINANIRAGIGGSHAVLVWWSADYLDSGVCLQEFRLAWQYARRHTSDVGQRIWIVNPEPAVGHILAGDLAGQNYLRPPSRGEEGAWADGLARRLENLLPTGSLSEEPKTLTWPRGYGLRPSTGELTGRGAELMRIHTAMFAPTVSGATAFISVQLQGMAGIGKTALAAAYADAFAAAYPGGIWWFNLAAWPRTTFESVDEAGQGWLEALQRALRDREPGLLAQLTQDQAKNVITPAEVRERVARYATGRGESFLWVLDGLPTVTARDLRAKAFDFLRAPEPGGHTLVTGRDSQTLPGATVMVLPPLTSDQAEQLLGKYLPPGQRRRDRAAIRELVTEVGAHPLALVLLGEYAKDRSIDCPQLLDQVRDRGVLQRVEEIHRRLAKELGDLTPSIVQAFLVNIEPLSPDAKRLLTLASVCAANTPIARRLLSDAFGGIDLDDDFGDALSALKRVSLVDTADPDPPSATVHPLVSAVVRNNVGSDVSAGQTAIAAALAKRCTDIDSSAATFVGLRGDLPHAEKLLPAVSGANGARLAAAMSHLYAANGNPAAALEAAQKAVTLAENSWGPDSRERIWVQSVLSRALARSGDLAGAARLQQPLLERATRLLGPDDHDTLTLWSDHAATLAKQHRYVAAEAAQRSLVQAVQGRFGDESAESLSAISALAATLYYQGKLVDARVLQEQALALAIKRSGQSSPDAIIAMGNLALTLRDQGYLDEALLLHSSVMNESRSVYGDDHPITRNSLLMLADAHAARGDFESAAPLYDETLAATINSLGEEDPESLETMSRLICIRLAMGQCSGAQPLLEKFWICATHVASAGHPQTLTAIEGVAEGLDKSGQSLGPLSPLLNQVLQARLRDLGENNIETIRAFDYLATAQAQIGETANAIALRRRALAASLVVHGNASPDTATAMVNLAVALRAGNETDEANETEVAAGDCIKRFFTARSADDSMGT